MTLKTILKNFLNYADTLEAQKKLGKDLYEVDFQKLKALTEELKHDKDYACSEGLKEVNRRKNRYKDILPYDYTRVILSEYPGVPGSDYINANYIKGASGSLAYIASQGPLPNTVVDFWRMIWECEIQVIVMACNEQESGKYKCECYWPTDEEKKQYGNINVEFVKWRQVCPDFLVRTLKACWENEERVICQFHYTTWPDHGVPNSVQPILELVRLIRDCQASEAVPVLVHCSAGCGRTGTICAIDYVWGLMRMGKLSKNFNLYNVIADMRKQRIAMVQTKEQYVLVHKAVSSLFEQQLRVIDSHTYENLDQDGEPLILKELNQQDEDIYEDILEPPLTEEAYVSEERKLPTAKMFHEQASENKDIPYISRKESSENLPNSTKSTYCKSENDSRQNEVQDTKNTVSCNRVENSKSEHNVKVIDNEPDNLCSRNSKILLKLCREESVKRLISGWNKAVEQTDDIKLVAKETHADNDVTSKSHVTKKFSDHLMYDSKPLSSNDVTFSQKTDNGSVSTDNSHKIDILCDDNITSDTSPKTSSPEDTHSGKLVGKATVIRRPSIAKLKALFEKTSQGNTDFTDSARQRRPLFRSHSHYVSHSSRQFTISDAEDQNFNSNQEVGISSITSSEESSSRKDNTAPKNITDSHIVHNFQNSGNTNIQHFLGNCIAESSQASSYSEQFTRDSSAELQSTEDNKQKYLLKYSKSSSATDNNKDHSTSSKENNYSTQYLGNCNNDFHHTADESKQKTSVKYRIHSIPSDTFKDTSKVSYMDKNLPNEKAECVNEMHSNSEAAANSKIKLKQCQSVTFKKEKPPDLPVKKKPAVPLPHSENSAEKSLPENVVPRFQINMPKLSHVFSDSHETKPCVSDFTSKSCNTPVSSDATPSKIISPHEMTYKVVKSAMPVVTSQDWNSEDSLREYRRHSQEVERRVLHKNQSFSDPEQSTTRSHDSSKQVVKPKLSLTDETHPKLAYCSGKSAVNDKSTFSPDCTYMNVNSLAQKNIRQIEDKLRDHPRGAIIDLTSRKSYIDDMNTTTEKQYIFRNTVQPVKFSQRQETRDLTPQGKGNVIKLESSTLKNSSGKGFPSVYGSKTAESKTETSKSDLDNINSKNLLLHSPPPKSKRGHSSKNSSIVSSSLPSANPVSDTSPNNSKIASSAADSSKQTNISLSSSSNTTITTSSTSTMADRSDPRYFPVTRQTASDAKYECEKQKASSRENFSASRSGNLYESHYSIHPSTSVYHKLPLPYDKSATEYDKYAPKLILKDVKYAHESNKNNSYDKEPLYGLQRSTSGPQILPSTSETSQKTPVSSEANRSFTLYNQVSEESRKPKSAPAVETRQQSHYNQNTSFGLYGAIGQQHSFPPGPPKPPRTFHYDVKSSQERIPHSEVYKGDQNIKRDGGRYIVSVASPKHSSQHPVLQATKNSSQEYRYPDDRLTESAHRSSNNSQLHQTTYGSSMPNEVHMSRSYPFATYDSLYSHPRPYGKQFYPESIGYRNVQPLTHVTSNVYSSVKEKPVHMHQNIYGTVKHRNTFSDYENVYDAQADYLHAMSNVGVKNEHQNQYQSINCNPMSGLQYSQSDASVYAVLQGQKPQASKSAHIPMDADYREVNKSAGNVPLPKRVYFDTLQRRQKQHVMWEQRRSHDDMDIRPAPSARLREQIHARRSMVELDNLEISIASDEGYPEKNISNASMSPTAHGSKIPSSKNDRVSETNQSKSYSENTDFPRETQHKKCSAHNKEPVSFGETLSKAFGKLTSFTKLNAKEAQSNSNPSDNGRSTSKASKQKDKEKAHNFSLQSPVNPKEIPSEQWTQV